MRDTIHNIVSHITMTIRKLDTKIVKDSDISQYKLLNVREQAIDDR